MICFIDVFSFYLFYPSNVIPFGPCSFVNEDITVVTALPIMNPNTMRIQFRYAFIFTESEEGSDLTLTQSNWMRGSRATEVGGVEQLVQGERSICIRGKNIVKLKKKLPG
jgi:hypothetical protein